MIKLNEKNFLKETKQGLILLDFYASWCMPCKVMARNLTKLEERTPKEIMRIYKIDIDENKKLADELNVIHLPTIIALYEGKELGRFEGCRTERDTQKMILEWINKS